MKATGSAPAATHVPTSSCMVKFVGVPAARMSIGRCPSTSGHSGCVIVIAGEHAERLERRRRFGELIGQPLPSIERR